MAISEQKRLFIGNLPPDIQDNELKQEFSYYGAVDKIEIKHKKGPDSDEVQNTFAFVTIGIDDRTLQQCLQEFKEQQFRGRFIQVTVARENFLEKLKREREEAAQHKPKKDESTKVQTETVKAVLPTISTGNSSSSESSSSDDSSEDESPPTQSKPVAKQNGSKKFKSSSESESDSNENEDNLVLRKKSRIFLENGKIKIDRSVSSGEAIHVIESKAKKAVKKELDEKSKKADQKRLESLNKMKNSYNEQKLAIKKALAGVDTAKRSNKIVFGDDDDEGTAVSVTPQSTKALTQTKIKEKFSNEKKPALFDDAEDSDDEKGFEGNFAIKQQFEGKKGEKLRRLQDRFQGDSRFKMDSKFMEDGSDESETEGGTSKQRDQKSVAKSSNDIETNETDERQWQLDILEKVMGKKISGNTPRETQKKAPLSMLRFDPTRAEHTKFVEPKVKKRKSKVNNEPESKRLKTEEDHEEYAEPENNEPPVSMDHFYEVRGDLKKSMGTGGFSLLSMFNRPAENADSTSAADKPYEEKLIAKNGVKFLADFDPFKYDSSEDEANDDKKKSNNESKSESDSKKLNLKYESFFPLNSSDERVSEGLAFFKPPEAAENDETNSNEYNDAQRQELKNIVKRKIKKSIQNALPRNAKPNKRFKRFAKNL
ncbi:probable RNA-binding protein CG14230 [Sitodiplosis mosellana]|uniref:probable RNA-binding protein CG14230 n=1 Tax=Sitodiplosis mosellana TaxID=263140 RepID=UPI0024451808|nr:probable RNA-binding protein CG14230 [Sitodiplosis mosellana]